MKDEILKEIIPLTQSDCFTVFSRLKDTFDFPIHYHDELELNLIINAKGAQRVIGDHISEIDEMELVLVGSNLQHAWFSHKCKSKEIREVTIQFHKDLLDERMLKRNQLSFIRRMINNRQGEFLFRKKRHPHLLKEF